MGGIGSGGHNAKPLALRVAEGEAPEQFGALLPKSEFPAMPQELAHRPIAQAMWEELEVIYENSPVKLLTIAQRCLLTAFCLEWETYIKCHDKIQAEGVVVQTKKGDGKKNPAATEKNAALDHIKGLAHELGLSIRSQQSTGQGVSISITELM